MSKINLQNLGDAPCHNCLEISFFLASLATIGNSKAWSLLWFFEWICKHFIAIFGVTCFTIFVEFCRFSVPKASKQRQFPYEWLTSMLMSMDTWSNLDFGRLKKVWVAIKKKLRCRFCMILTTEILMVLDVQNQSSKFRRCPMSQFFGNFVFSCISCNIWQQQRLVTALIFWTNL